MTLNPLLSEQHLARPPIARAQWRRLLGYVRPYKNLLGIALLARMIASGVFLALPALIQRVVDSEIGRASCRERV